MTFFDGGEFHDFDQLIQKNYVYSNGANLNLVYSYNL